MIEIKGYEGFREWAKRLEAAVRHDLQKAMNDGIEAGMKPLPAKIRASADATLPRRGGLAADVARSRISLKKIPNGMRLEVTGIYNLTRINAGRVVHPVYGHRVHVSQSVTPGWFDKPTKAAEPEIAKATDREVGRMAAKI